MPHAGTEIIWAIVVGTLALFIVIVIFITSVILSRRKFISIERQMLEGLQQRNDQLRMLSARLQSIREEERTRIAREIHDELGSMLTVLKMELAVMEKKLTPPALPKTPEVKEQFDAASRKIDVIVRSVRRIATELRPGVLDEFGLKEAMEAEMDTFRARTGIHGWLTGDFDDSALDDNISTALFRIFQETLTNIARHAQATEVHIMLHFSEGTLLLEVADNGRGITAAERSGLKSLGLLGMKERAQLVGGDITINGAPGKGTTVTVSVPLPEETAAVHLITSTE